MPTLTPARDWTPADHPKDVARLKTLAATAAETFLDRVLTLGVLHEHAGDAFCDVSDALEATSSAYLTDAAKRREGADTEAAFLIGLAIGRRLGGAR